MSKVLHVSPDVASDVLEHALQQAPDECCGILLGPDEHRASRALPAENVHENPRTEYEIDPDALAQALRRAEASEDTVIVGFYHSHPSGHAAFSRTDVARGSWQGKTYLLASLAPLTFLAGIWNGESFDEVAVHVAHDG